MQVALFQPAHDKVRRRSPGGESFSSRRIGLCECSPGPDFGQSQTLDRQNPPPLAWIPQISTQPTGQASIYARASPEIPVSNQNPERGSARASPSRIPNVQTNNQEQRTKPPRDPGTSNFCEFCRERDIGQRHFCQSKRSSALPADQPNGKRRSLRRKAQTAPNRVDGSKLSTVMSKPHGSPPR